MMKRTGLIAVLLVLVVGCGQIPTGSESEQAVAGDEGGTTAPRPEPQRQPTPPVVKTVVKSVPIGTAMEIEFLDALSSRDSQVGDPFRAGVVADVTYDGAVVIPAGTIVAGAVTEVQSLKKIGGRAKLGLAFQTLKLATGELPITASFLEQGKSETKKDAATIGGATAGGALLGRMIKRKDEAKGTLIGAIVGGAVGTAIAAKTEGEEVTIPAGLVVSIKLDTPVDVKVRG